MSLTGREDPLASPRPWTVTEREEKAFGEPIWWVEVRSADGHLISAQCVLLALPDSAARRKCYRANADDLTYDGYRE